MTSHCMRTICCTNRKKLIPLQVNESILSFALPSAVLLSYCILCGLLPRLFLWACLGFRLHVVVVVVGCMRPCVSAYAPYINDHPSCYWNAIAMALWIMRDAGHWPQSGAQTSAGRPGEAAIILRHANLIAGCDFNV